MRWILLLSALPFFTFSSTTERVPCNGFVMEQIEYMEDVGVVHTHLADTNEEKYTPQFGAYIYLSNYVKEDCIMALLEEYDDPCVRSYAYASLVYKSSRKLSKATKLMSGFSDSVDIQDRNEIQRVSLPDFASNCLAKRSYIKEFGL